jgi:hypothetical protein
VARGLGSIAEISLLGCLGCGRQLVSLVAEDLLAQGGYSHLVLQVLDAGLGWCPAELRHAGSGMSV